MASIKKQLTVLSAILTCAIMLPSAARAQSAAKGPTDPQIVGIVEGANQIDINYAHLALQKSKNKEVRGFAQQMITDHTALQNAVKGLAAKLGVKPATSDTAKSLESQAHETMSKLKGLEGSEFDKAYVDNEIAFHKLVINANSSTLIPSANNAQLKEALQNAQPLFQGHLEHAEKVQQALGGPSQASASMHKH
jgi:putative membrane protein